MEIEEEKNGYWDRKFKFEMENLIFVTENETKYKKELVVLKKFRWSMDKK